MANPRSLFFIDDDCDDLDLLCEAVSIIDESIICFKADNSESTLEAFRKDDIPVPDLIFLDLNMPKVNGRELLQEIKKMPSYAHIPVVIYSTSVSQADIEETMKLGASYFLSKPNRFEDLQKSLEHIFSLNLSVSRAGNPVESNGKR
jgi:CheY-like chemotaxis protein